MDLYEIRNKLSMGMSLSNIRLRVTDYARVSTESENQKKSLNNQIEHFDEYIKQNKNWIYVPGYVDDGISGTSDIKRNNFMQMIEDAKKGKFDLIVTKEISRFSRNTLDSIKYTRLLLSYGVFVLFVNDNINTALPDSELRLTIMASMAQDEIRRLSERVKFGMNRAIKRGEILGNNKLYGYVKDKNSGNLLIVNNEAIIVKKIYELYVLKKLSLAKIVNILNNDGIRTRDGNKWSVSTISRMIKNPKYKGYYCGKKSEVVDYMDKRIKYFEEKDWIIYEDSKRIPVIISEYLWDRANERIKSRRKFKKSVIKENGNYLYSGKIFCKNDGSVFNRRIFRKNKRDVTWICSKYLSVGKKMCDSPNIRESELDFIFLDLINNFKLDILDIVNLLKELYSTVLKDNDNKSLVVRSKIKINKLMLKKDRLLELNMDGSLSNEEFCYRNDLLNMEIKAQNELIDKELDSKFGVDSQILEIETILLDKINNIKIDKLIIDIILKKIIVSKISNEKMEVNIYLKRDFCNNLIDSCIFSKEYEFKRGYDVVGTKRYKVYYKVNCYFK